MKFISYVFYHFFNMIFKIILVVAGLVILIIGTNIFMAKSAEYANRIVPGSNRVAWRIEIPAFVPEKIRNPINLLQQKAETYISELINLNDMPFLAPPITDDPAEPQATETVEPLATDNPTVSTEEPNNTVTEIPEISEPESYP